MGPHADNARAAETLLSNKSGHFCERVKIGLGRRLHFYHSRDLDLSIRPTLNADRTVRGSNDGQRASDAEIELVGLVDGALCIRRVLSKRGDRKPNNESGEQRQVS